jgi:hypothetical protein
MDKEDDLDAMAQELADAVRKARPVAIGILAGIVVLVIIVVFVLPNAVALIREFV